MSGGSFISACTTCGQRRYSYTPRILTKCGMIKDGATCNGIYELLADYKSDPGQTQMRDWE